MGGYYESPIGGSIGEIGPKIPPGCEPRGSQVGMNLPREMRVPTNGIQRWRAVEQSRLQPRGQMGEVFSDISRTHLTAVMHEMCCERGTCLVTRLASSGRFVEVLSGCGGLACKVHQN
jgi:hypothetical protein